MLRNTEHRGLETAETVPESTCADWGTGMSMMAVINIPYGIGVIFFFGSRTKNPDQTNIFRIKHILNPERKKK